MAEKTEEQLTAEKAAEEQRQADQAARAAKEAEVAEKLRAADEARIRAEAERDALKLVATSAPQQAQAAWTEEQWKDFEDQSGINKKQFLAQAQIAKQLVEAQQAQFEKKFAELAAQTKAAEDKAARAEGYRAEEITKRDFYASRPALARYDKDVTEFVERFPSEERSDPKKYRQLLDMAEMYVKGKVGANMRTGGGGSPRFERDENLDLERREEPEIDLSGLDKGQADVLRSIVPSAEREKELKAYAKVDKSGVEFRGENEWESTRQAIRKEFRRG